MAIVSARSSALGRAPVGPDIDLAIGLLDLPTGAEAVSGIAHDHSRLRRLVEGIPRDVLMGPMGGSGGES
jgi:hypothetical protein